MYGNGYSGFRQAPGLRRTLSGQAAPPSYRQASSQSISMGDNTQEGAVTVPEGPQHVVVNTKDFILAMQSGDVSEVKRYLTAAPYLATQEIAHSPINTGRPSCTPLSYAAHVGDNSILTLLLDRGAKVHLDGLAKGRAPLHHACSRSHENIVKHLIQEGANVNLQDHQGCTPMMYACDNGNVEIITMLIEASADINITDESGDTALHRVCLSKSTKAARLLLDVGASRHTCNLRREIALHVAVVMEDEDMARLLLEGDGAGLVNAKTNYGKRAYSLAKQKRMKEVLISYGAKKGIFG